MGWALRYHSLKWVLILFERWGISQLCSGHALALCSGITPTGFGGNYMVWGMGAGSAAGKVSIVSFILDLFQVCTTILFCCYSGCGWGRETQWYSRIPPRFVLRKNLWPAWENRQGAGTQTWLAACKSKHPMHCTITLVSQFLLTSFHIQL